MGFSPLIGRARLPGMSDDLDWYAARDMLEWQVELGATEAIGDVPVDRYALSAQTPKPAPHWNVWVLLLPLEHLSKVWVWGTVNLLRSLKHSLPMRVFSLWTSQHRV